MKLLLHTLITILIFWSCKQTTSTVVSFEEPEWADSLVTELNAINEQGYINGYGVAIVDQNGTLYQQGFGYADVENKKPYTDSTLQNIGSISKTFLGIALLKAQELGKLNLDDDINKYLPFRLSNPYYPNAIITIRHLATHTSTICDTDYYGKSYILKDKRASSITPSLGSEDFLDPDSTMSLGTFLEKYLSTEGKWYLKEGFINKQPGALYEYTNVGATLAAYILELATDESYQAFTRRYILKPLKMSNSGWAFDSINFEQHTKLYHNPQIQLPFYSLITYPDGGLLTSVNDMGKYLAELINGYSGNGTLLNQASYQTLFEQQLSEANFEERAINRPYDDEFNSGIFMGHTPIGHIGHSGGDPGVSTFMFFDPEAKVGRLLFINTGLEREGAKQYFAIWNKLEKYANK
jgi:CubicO group peptidase (beta-lactamase class C family)